MIQPSRGTILIITPKPLTNCQNQYKPKNYPIHHSTIPKDSLFKTSQYLPSFVSKIPPKITMIKMSSGIPLTLYKIKYTNFKKCANNSINYHYNKIKNTKPKQHLF